MEFVSGSNVRMGNEMDWNKNGELERFNPKENFMLYVSRSIA